MSDDSDKQKSKAQKPKTKRKKDSQFVIRLDKTQRDEFVDACQELDTSAAREIRRFIKQFLQRYEKGEFNDH